MNYTALKYKHSSYQLLSTVLPFEVIKRKSKTLIYGIDDGGYQRAQDEKHFQNIRKYIEKGNFVFPNAIILAIDETELLKILKSDSENAVSLDLDDKIQFLFRVVDGQHRLLGIEQAMINNPSLKNLELQVSIVVTPINKRSIEMEIFSNINSKAKRLKTDLIELAKYDFRLIEENIGSTDLIPHIAINTAYNLNENYFSENVWQNAIKIDIHAENKIGIVGVTAFSESISGIVSSYISLNLREIQKMEGKDLIIFSRMAAKDIADYLVKVWTIVHDRWSKTFLDPYKVLDIDDQYKTIAYDPNFYVQKTLGCKSIGYVVNDILRDEYNSKFNRDSLAKFEKIIQECKLIDSDWQLGKTLSGISSESGFRKVARIIKNEEKFVRKE